MSQEPKVSAEERIAQTERLYGKIGKIAVLGEHVNFAMNSCCLVILQNHGLEQPYAQTVLVGQNLENMRRAWEALMKQHYSSNATATGMIDHLSTRLDNVIRRRNNTVHGLWFIGWGNEETTTFEVASSFKGARDIGKNGQGGVKYTSRDTQDFEEIIAEMQKLNDLLLRFRGCIVGGFIEPELGKLENNFQYTQGILESKQPSASTN